MKTTNRTIWFSDFFRMFRMRDHLALREDMVSAMGIEPMTT
jgi:hypothetical protein